MERRALASWVRGEHTGCGEPGGAGDLASCLLFPEKLLSGHTCQGTPVRAHLLGDMVGTPVRTYQPGHTLLEHTCHDPSARDTSKGGRIILVGNSLGFQELVLCAPFP